MRQARLAGTFVGGLIFALAPGVAAAVPTWTAVGACVDVSDPDGQIYGAFDVGGTVQEIWPVIDETRHTCANDDGDYLILYLDKVV
jgi:hypothetical protein